MPHSRARCNPQEPRARPDEGSFIIEGEPPGGRARIDALWRDVCAQVVAEVLQDVADGVLHFAARFQGPGVIPVREHLAGAPRSSVECARDADGESLDALCQARRAIGLDDKVEMVSLDGEVHDAEPEPLARTAQG